MNLLERMHPAFAERRARLEQASARLRRMTMARNARLFVAVLLCCTVSACAGEVHSESSGNGHCVSSYAFVVRAPTWPRLKDALLEYHKRGHAASIRVQAMGPTIDSLSDKNVVRVIDVLGPNGGRLDQLDVWRAPDGAWRAGLWGQCTD